MIAIQYFLVFWMIYLTVFSILQIKKKNKIWIHNSIIISIFGILDVIRFINDGQHSVRFYDSPLTLTIAILLLVYSAGGFTKLSIWIIVLCSLWMIVVINTIATGFVLPFLGIDIRYLSINPILSVLGLIIGASVVFFLSFLIKRLDLRIDVFSLSKIDVFSIIVFMITFGFYVGNMQIFIFETAVTYRLVFNIVSLFVGVVPIYGVFYIITQKKYIKDIRYQEEQQALLFEEERKHFEQIREIDQEIKKFKHDISDEIEHIEQLVNNGNLEEVIEHIGKMKIETNRIISPKIFYTGLNSVNSSWYNLTTNEKYKDINYKWLGTIPPNLIIENRDMMKLFSNLLKNAFEASNKAIGHKFIWVEISNDDCFRIKITNSHANNIISLTNGTFETSKLDKKSHGIGTQIIMDIVNKYNGFINHEFNDTEFTVKIVFNNPFIIE